ncbi:hypothetical protein IAU60_005218 [Kwoniella sp. DSM 27419]
MYVASLYWALVALATASFSTAAPHCKHRTKTSSAATRASVHTSTSVIATKAAAVSTTAISKTAARTTTSSSAGAKATSVGSTDANAQTLVKLHNDFRAEYGAGPVTWNADLAAYAATHAAGCKMQHTGGPYGENLAAGSGGGYDVTKAFNSWAAEADQYNPSNPTYSHFTQVVWKATTEIGCAVQTCPDGSLFSTGQSALLVFCEYNPPGNYNGQYAQNVGTKKS